MFDVFVVHWNCGEYSIFDRENNNNNNDKIRTDLQMRLHLRKVQQEQRKGKQQRTQKAQHQQTSIVELIGILCALLPLCLVRPF